MVLYLTTSLNDNAQPEISEYYIMHDTSYIGLRNLLKTLDIEIETSVMC